MRKNKFGIQLKEYLEYNNISNNDFSERINTTPKNLIDIIKGDVELSQNMIYNISFITEIPVSYIENVELNFRLDNTINNYLEKNNLTIKQFINKFSYKEFSKEYQVKFTDERNDIWIAKDIMKYLRITNPETLYKQDNSIFYKSKNDKPELLSLWLERCYKVVSKQQVNKYNKDNINILVNYIKDCASKNLFNKNELIKQFNENGIFLAIENDLKGSKIRGAFKVLNDKPAIYITKKYKRYADIYFALLHELAHCKSDFNRAKSGSIVSIEDQFDKEEYELKADKTALNWMINDKEYELIKNEYNDIDNLNVVKSFYVYRLAKDKIIDYSSKLYQENNKLLDINEENL